MDFADALAKLGSFASYCRRRERQRTKRARLGNLGILYNFEGKKFGDFIHNRKNKFGDFIHNRKNKLGDFVHHSRK
ncbi:MAG: hypothetical protein IJR26_09025 [Bacteroidales bacterium]|nr:hypothetical protein [Bacteroidales bacterium]